MFVGEGVHIPCVGVNGTANTQNSLKVLGRYQWNRYSMHLQACFQYSNGNALCICEHAYGLPMAMHYASGLPMAMHYAL